MIYILFLYSTCIKYMEDRMWRLFELFKHAVQLFRLCWFQYGIIPKVSSSIQAKWIAISFNGHNLQNILVNITFSNIHFSAKNRSSFRSELEKLTSQSQTNHKNNIKGHSRFFFSRISEGLENLLSFVYC